MINIPILIFSSSTIYPFLTTFGIFCLWSLNTLQDFWFPDSARAVTNLFLQICFIFLKMLKDAPPLKFDLVANPAPNIKRLNSFLQLFTTIIHQFICYINIGNYRNKFTIHIFGVLIISKFCFGG